MVAMHTHEVSTKGQGDTHDLTRVIAKAVAQSKIQSGIVTVFVDNGSSHVRAALLGPSVTVPFKDGELLLGQWRQIALFEFDTRPRRREVVVQMIGE